jgi:tetratricopeptide (TPR) repeat protein
MRRGPCPAGAVALALGILLCAATPHAAAAPSAGGLGAYAEGLEALGQARWADGIAAFGRALQASGDDPTFVLARGVALTLAGQFAPGLADLQRVERLGLKGREAKLWIYAAEAMSGSVSPANQIGGGGPRSLQGSPEAQRLRSVVSVPGHVIQGRDDYSTEYASFIIYQMAMPYQTARTSGASVDTPAIRRAVAEAGRRFADKWLARPDLASAHLERARELHAARRFDAALQAVSRARAAYPTDPTLVFYGGDSWLALGRPATARRELTLALTGKTDFAAAYLARAMAGARLGDGRRAKADLDVAAGLDAAGAGRARSAVEAELTRARSDGAPEALVAELEQAARAGAPMEQLVTVATRLHKLVGERRLRFDESYQERRRVLEGAVRASPRNPDRLFELARYVSDESKMRGESVEPRRELQPYRRRASREAELAEAEGLLDQAIAIQPRHVRSIMQKAMIRAARRQYADADALVTRALQIAPNDPDALQMYARFRLQNAAALAAQAASLRQDRCSSSSSLETRSDGLYRVTTTTCTPPSAADLQRAAQLDAQAAAERQKASAAIEAALKATRGTVQGYLLQADVEIMRGQYDAAARSLQEAIRLDPKSLEAHEQLMDLYAKTGQTEKAEEYASFVKNTFIQTTAAHMLRLSWGRITKTAWQGSRAALAAGQKLDPVDARVPAYLSVVLAGEGKADEAGAALRTGLALEEARLRLDEGPAAPGAPLARDPQELALLMGLRLRLAGTLARAGRAADALELYRANLAHEPQVAPSARGTPMFPAMLPDPALPQGTVPGPVNAASFLAESHLGAGRALRALGKTDEAMREFAAVMAFGPRPGIPRVGTAKGDTNFADEAGAPVGEAGMELARAAIQRGDYATAMQALQAATGSLPDHLRREANELNLQIAKNWRPGATAPRAPLSQAPAAAPGGGPPGLPPGSPPSSQQARRTGEAVDPALVGTWEGLMQTPQGAARVTYVISADGTYTARSQGASGSGSARGQVRSQDGRLTFVNQDGRRSEAAYRVDARLLRLQSEGATIELQRRR